MNLQVTAMITLELIGSPRRDFAKMCAEQRALLRTSPLARCLDTVLRRSPLDQEHLGFMKSLNRNDIPIAPAFTRSGTICMVSPMLLANLSGRDRETSGNSH